MTIQQIVTDTDYSVRTQISLSPSLYNAVKQRAKKEGKSLAEITREGLLLKLEAAEVIKKDERAKLKKLVTRTKASIKSGEPGWGQVDDLVAHVRENRLNEERLTKYGRENRK